MGTLKISYWCSTVLVVRFNGVYKSTNADRRHEHALGQNMLWVPFGLFDLSKAVWVQEGSFSQHYAQ